MDGQRREGRSPLRLDLRDFVKHGRGGGIGDSSFQRAVIHARSAAFCGFLVSSPDER